MGGIALHICEVADKNTPDKGRGGDGERSCSPDDLRGVVAQIELEEDTGDEEQQQPEPKEKEDVEGLRRARPDAGGHGNRLVFLSRFMKGNSTYAYPKRLLNCFLKVRRP